MISGTSDFFNHIKNLIPHLNGRIEDFIFTLKYTQPFGLPKPSFIADKTSQ